MYFILSAEGVGTVQLRGADVSLGSRRSRLTEFSENSIFIIIYFYSAKLNHAKSTTEQETATRRLGAN